MPGETHPVPIEQVGVKRYNKANKQNNPEAHKECAQPVFRQYQDNDGAHHSK